MVRVTKYSFGAAAWAVRSDKTGLQLHFLIPASRGEGGAKRRVAADSAKGKFAALPCATSFAALTMRHLHLM
jgi:hypothetical protein